MEKAIKTNLDPQTRLSLGGTSGQVTQIARIR